MKNQTNFALFIPNFCYSFYINNTVNAKNSLSKIFLNLYSKLNIFSLRRSMQLLKKPQQMLNKPCTFSFCIFIHKRYVIYLCIVKKTRYANGVRNGEEERTKKNVCI